MKAGYSSRGKIFCIRMLCVREWCSVVKLRKICTRGINFSLLSFPGMSRCQLNIAAVSIIVYVKAHDTTQEVAILLLSSPPFPFFAWSPFQIVPPADCRNGLVLPMSWLDLSRLSIPKKNSSRCSGQVLAHWRLSTCERGFSSVSC